MTLERPTADQVRLLTEQGIGDRNIGKRFGFSDTFIRKLRIANGIPAGRYRAKPGSRRWKEHYATYTPEPGVKVADEAAWAAALAGGRFEDGVCRSAGLLRMVAPAIRSTGDSSMAWAG